MPSSLTPQTKTVIYGCALAVDVVLFDQVTKWLMIAERDVPLFPPFFSLTYAENRGIAFSLPLEGLLQQVITVGLIALLVVLVVRYRTWKHRWLHFSLMLVIGGAVGNAIDRLLRGYVVDFIAVGSFPIFNLADTAVCLGVAGAIFYELVLKKQGEAA